MEVGWAVLYSSRCVCLSIHLLFNIQITSQYADEAQQAFSAASGPTLHNALPAVEALHVAWMKAAGKDKYEPFDEALEAATEKLGEYYNETAASDAHIISMGIVITLPSISLGQ